MHKCLVTETVLLVTITDTVAFKINLLKNKSPEDLPSELSFFLYKMLYMQILEIVLGMWGLQ